MKYVDSLNGRQFEKWVYKLAKFTDPLNHNYIKLTPSSDDFGIDVISGTEGVQCKHVTGSIVGYKAIEEAVTGTKYYGLEQPVVITNGMFSNHAKKGAKELNVILVNRDTLQPTIKLFNLIHQRAEISDKYLLKYHVNNINIGNYSRIKAIQQILGIKGLYTDKGFNITLSKILENVSDKMFNSKKQKDYNTITDYILDEFYKIYHK